MKKKLSIIIILITMLTLTSCACKLSNNYKEMPNGVDITIKSEYKEHMLIQETIPSLHFDYNGVRISTDLSDDSIVFFVQNNQIALSDAYAKHLSQYATDELIITKSEERVEKKGAVLGKEKYPIDEGTKSLEQIVIATAKDGTRYSYSFRTFTSGGKVYYAYKYIENMSIALEMPLMTVINNNQRKLVLLPLPYDTKYIVGGRNIDLKKLLTEDQYLHTTAENYYIFNYCPYIQNITQDKEESITLVKKWYETYCNGRMQDGYFIIEYLGVKFSIDFNYEKMNNTTEKVEPAYKINYIGLAQ